MRGVKPDWTALPRRQCDNCGARYQPFRPVKPGEHGFCADNCRKEFHKHGGAFVKLKPYVVQEIKKRIRQLNPADAERIAALERQLQKIQNTLEGIERAFFAPGKSLRRE